MLTLDQNGNLTPYNAVSVTLPELHAAFVATYPTSEYRPLLYQQLEAFLDAFKVEITTTFTLFIDGSFVTSKLNPKDIDLVVFLDYTIYEANESTIASFKGKRRFSLIDSYIEKAYPSNHPFYIRYQSDLAYWHSLFVRNRKRERKGYATIRYDV